MPTISQEKREKIARDYCNGVAYKELIKKYKCGSSTIHRVLSTFKADWFDLDKIKKERREKRVIKPPDNIEQIAKDYKDGLPYKKLQEKYGYKQHTLCKFFKDFEQKVDWFDLRMISRFHSTSKNKGKKYNKVSDINTNSVYANFLSTLISCGLTETEAWGVMNFLLKKTDANYYADQLTSNKEVMKQIIKKANLKSLEIVFQTAIKKEAAL